MSTLRKLFRLLRRDRMDAELGEEMELHRILIEKECLDAGLSPAEAAREARRRMGNETLAREDAREAWTFRLLEDLLRDFRYGVRVSVRNGRAAVMTVFALGVGIGLVAAVSFAYKELVARPLDARDAHRMVNMILMDESGAPQYEFSYPDYLDYREQATSFSGLIAGRYARVSLSKAGETVSQQESIARSGFGRLGIVRPGVLNAEIARAHVVSLNYFEVLGVSAVQGRTFGAMTAEELRAQPAVLVSENFRSRRFRGDADIVGKTVELNGVSVRIAGVAPRDFVGTDMVVPAFWIPIVLEPLLNPAEERLDDREARRYSVRGRLASGVGIAQAQAEIDAIAERLRPLHAPDSALSKPTEALVWPGSPHGLPISMLGMDAAALAPLFAALLVLAVAGANVAGLQLARARSRRPELRARLALGASRIRVVRQLLVESVCVAAAAGVVALLCTWFLLKQLGGLIASAIPLEEGVPVFDPTPDLGTIAFVLGVALAAGAASGLTPALESTRAALADSIRSSGSAVRGRRLRNVLLGAQTALSLFLLIGAGAFVHSSFRALNDPTGYDAEKVVLVDFQFPESLDYVDARKQAVVEELRARLAEVPGVSAVTSARAPVAQRFQTAAAPADQAAPLQGALAYTYVEPNYFRTLGIPLLAGAGLPDGAGVAHRLVVVSESAAERLWPGRNPLGRTLRLGPAEERRLAAEERSGAGAAYQVVGVAADKRVLSLDGGHTAEAYLPLPAAKLADRPILVRIESDPADLLGRLEQLVRGADPDLLVSAVALDDALRQTPLFVASSMGAAVASVVGSCGLLLALMGVYGTVSYVAAARSREVGIRIAVGAQRRDVIRLILHESLRPVLAGLAAGAIAASAGSFVLGRLLYGVNGVDAVSVAGVSALFAAITAAAAYAPARRAAGIDPMTTLREE